MEGGSLVVEYGGKQYDVGKFAGKHPGGAHLLRKAAGMDVEAFLKGTAAVDGKKHEHSVNAYRILDKYCLGDNSSTEEEEMVDLDKPIVCQVGKLGHHYWDWIHKPVDKDLRMFQSDFLEYFSRTHWAAIPAVWMPLVIFFLFLGSNSLSAAGWEGKAHSGALMAMFLGGILWWTQMEYCLHRFAFHWRPSPLSPNQITFHFLLHGLHHKTPMDKGRLVFPPPLGGIFVAIVFSIHLLLLPRPLAQVLSAGALFGYVCYDLIHYYLHHGTPPAHSYCHALKHYHHNHHFKNPDLSMSFAALSLLRNSASDSYGITSKLWDVSFRTVGAG